MHHGFTQNTICYTNLTPLKTDILYEQKAEELIYLDFSNVLYAVQCGNLIVKNWKNMDINKK